MSNSQTEGTNLAVAPETVLGTVPGSGWVNLQPNSYGDVGASVRKVARTPISKNRQNRKPLLVDLDSGVPFGADLTKDFVDTFLAAMMMASVKHSGGTGVSRFEPTVVVDGGVSADSYTVAAGGALAAKTLIYVRGWANDENNGLKVVDAGSAAGSINVATGTLVAEAAVPTGVTPTIDVVGVQGAAADITIDADGNLTSTALDWTTLGLTVGQWIYLPSAADATEMGDAKYAFGTVAYTGFARIAAIAATKLTLERRSWTVGAADAGAAKEIRVFFSRYCRNVAYDHADAAKPSFSFEVTYPDLGGVGVPMYEYARGNLLSETVLNIPLTDKATVDLAFVGTTTDVPTSVRAGGADAAVNPLAQVALSTSVDLMRFEVTGIDESGITTDFKSVRLSFRNNVNPEKQLGTLGAAIMNVGRFELGIDADLVFTSSEVAEAVRDNRTIRMAFGLRNSDFGLLIDVMSATFDEGDREFPTNESVKIKTKATGYQDATLASTVGISVFGYLPGAAQAA